MKRICESTPESCGIYQFYKPRETNCFQEHFSNMWCKYIKVGESWNNTMIRQNLFNCLLESTCLHYGGTKKGYCEAWLATKAYTRAIITSGTKLEFLFSISHNSCIRNCFHAMVNLFCIAIVERINWRIKRTSR